MGIDLIQILTSRPKYRLKCYCYRTGFAATTYGKLNWTAYSHVVMLTITIQSLEVQELDQAAFDNAIEATKEAPAGVITGQGQTVLWMNSAAYCKISGQKGWTSIQSCGRVELKPPWKLYISGGEIRQSG